FARAIVEYALAARHAAEIEAQDGEVALGKRIIQGMHDRVVHRSPEGGVRMQYDGNGSVRALVMVIAALNAARRAIENHFRHLDPQRVLLINSKIGISRSTCGKPKTHC